MRVVIEFTQDFATKKKGESCEYTSQFAARLIQEGVAKKTSVKVEESPKRKRRTKEQIEADKKAE